MYRTKGHDIRREAAPSGVLTISNDTEEELAREPATVLVLHTFWASARDSMAHPSAQSTMPAMSLDCPKDGFDPPRRGSETAGELRITTGRETVQTCES